MALVFSLMAVTAVILMFWRVVLAFVVCAGLTIFLTGLFEIAVRFRELR